LRATLQQQVLQEHNYVAQVHGDSQPRHWTNIVRDR
jgi:hypothetical protein